MLHTSCCFLARFTSAAILLTVPLAHLRCRASLPCLIKATLESQDKLTSHGIR